MTGTVTIGTTNVGMTANAASPFIFRQVHKKDFLKVLDVNDVDAQLFVEMGYVMAMQYECGTTGALNKTQADFLEWLSQFGPMDVLNATGAIMALYVEQQDSTANPKKDSD